MCGICGIWGSEAFPRVERMVAAMHHRGPDDRGIHCEPGVVLGMTRLAILDVSESGHQPMSTPDRGIWIVYNGEVYNFQSERALLESVGYRFASNTDTEVVLRMYEHYGDDFVMRLRGMFAFAIYDKRRGPGKERLVLARDHLGIKPLLYAWVGSQLIFASEMKAILASGLVQREVDPEALRLLLTYGSVSQPATIVKNIKMLMPGHRMIVESGRRRLEGYWSLRTDTVSGLRQKPYPEQVEAVSASLEESVRLQMRSDVPLGAFLSGGIDSSLLVGFMTRLAGRKVKTFSIGFDREGADVDESGDAAQIAKFIGTEHHHVLINGEFIRTYLQDAVRALDQPSVDGINSYCVAFAASRHVTVAISGLGGDELFAGYYPFIAMAAATDWAARYPVRATAKAWLASLARWNVFDALIAGRLGAPIHRVRGSAGFVSQYARDMVFFGAREAARVLSPDLRQEARAGRAEADDVMSQDELPAASPLDRVSALCLRGYTQNQLLRDVDAVSMAHSLEVRVPFLDPLVVDVALSLPRETKLGAVIDAKHATSGTYRQTGVKRILLDVGRGVIPGGLDGYPKRGFRLPMAAWLKGPLRDTFEAALSPRQLRQRGYFDVKQVETYKARFLADELEWYQPWLLTITELWCQQVLDRPAASF